MERSGHPATAGNKPGAIERPADARIRRLTVSGGFTDSVGTRTNGSYGGIAAVHYRSGTIRFEAAAGEDQGRI